MSSLVNSDDVPISNLPNNDRILRLKQIFCDEFGCEPLFYVRVPGRVNLIGEHIDYCGYPVLPMALEQDILIAAGLINEPKLYLKNVNNKYDKFDTDIRSHDNIKIISDVDGKPFWYNYVLCGVKGGLEFLNNKIVKGLQLCVDGNVPPASGLSSSSALVSAACLALLYAQNVPLSKTEIASLCAKSERYIGTEGGGMDQAIAFLGQKNCAQYITWQPLKATPVTLPANAVFIVAHSLAKLNKAATNDYNRRVTECRLAAKILVTCAGAITDKKIITLGQAQHKLDKNLEDMVKLVHEYLPKDVYTKHNVCEILNISEKELNELYCAANTKHLTEFKLKQRALHVYEEAIRVEEFRKQCVESVQNKNGVNGVCETKEYTVHENGHRNDSVCNVLGQLMTESHKSLKNLYECSHANLDYLVELLEEINVHSRLTGAGWGGLKEESKPTTTELKTCWSSSYKVIGSDQDINEVVCVSLDRERVGPHTPEGDEKENLEDNNNYQSNKKSKATAKRRSRRNKLKSHRSSENYSNGTSNDLNCLHVCECSGQNAILNHTIQKRDEKDNQINKKEEENKKMSDNKSRDDVKAARQAKKLAKQKGKAKYSTEVKDKPEEVSKQEVEVTKQSVEVANEHAELIDKVTNIKEPGSSPKSKDEVDKVGLKVESVSIDGDKDKEQIKAERAAKKAAKQAKKRGAGEGEAPKGDEQVSEASDSNLSKPVNEDMTVKDVVETLRDIVIVAKDIKNVTDKVSAIDLSGRKSQPDGNKKSKPEESGKSKAELKAERRAKQEAQRALKQASQEHKEVTKPKADVKAIVTKDTPSKDDKIVKVKAEKSKAKSLNSHRVNWFQHLYKEQDKPLKSIAINSHLHPAIIKLGVQLATRVVTGSNARCVALLDALKKMVRDYTLPAKTEFGRGLEAHLAASVEFLWAQRAPSASQSNAVKFFRYHLTQLPNNVDEFDAKKTLQEEIDRYIREQIDMAGEAISIAVRNKISEGDNILTYGRSSLVERILREAWSGGARFRVVVAGSRALAAHGLLRALVAHGLPCTYVDITALQHVMSTINKVIVGAGALLGNGSVLGAVGTAQVALAARAHNVPTLVACETHKFSPRVQTDAFVYNEIGDPDDLVDKSDNNSPLKDWRSNPNLTPLNLTYDVTPASLVTAVVTELAILPCTSAPVVLRFKLSEYGV
ncbi:unnamed protein product [Arctia plantaginis]|uniref:Translation initiation factor eIF2B subunit delta n=1 Tax=Arctia plantaginis TaxID=874455 RepID=A0A8S1A5U2_ARCPL|nr:unnamed protein product [Arctia plantaginis]